MNITNAKYKKPVDDNNNIIDGSENISIEAIVDGIPTNVPLQAGNRHYDEIMRQQSEGLLTIEDAE